MTNLYPSIVAFGGPKFAGKSTAAKLLLTSGYHLISFAAPLKDMLLTFGLTKADLVDPVLKETPHPLLGGKTPRWAMQSLGTDWGRQMIWDDIWVNLTRVRVQKLVADGIGVVFDDCRFDNEAIPLLGLGGVIVEVTRSGCAYSPGHKSEAGLSRSHITTSITNDGTTEEMHARLDAELQRLRATTAFAVAA